MIYLILLVSLVLNGFFVWYVYNLLRDRIALVELFKKFSPIIKNYETHLDSLTKMDMYFGDPTLTSLIEHTKEINKALDDAMQSIEIVEQDDNTEEKE